MSAIRGPGIQLPLTSPQINGTPGELMLSPGGIYVVPQGNYICQLGVQTVAQWYDPNNGLWRVVQPSGDLMQISSDGGNYRLVNASGIVAGASITNAGSGGANGIGPVQTGSTVTFGAPAAGGATATATGYVIVGGSVQAPTITQGGSGFLVPPAVFCDPPPQGGVQATAVATISSAGVITAITMVNVGAGYTSSPIWYIAPQNFNGYLTTPDRTTATGLYPPPGLIHPANTWPGTLYQPNLSSALGALLTPNALTGSGTLTGIVMTYYGAGYTGSTLPSITFGGTSLGTAAATPVMSYCVTGTSVTGAGTGYIVGAPAITTLGLILGASNNSSFVPRPSRGKITNANGTYTIEDPGFGLQAASGIGIGGGSITSLATVPAASLGGVNDVSILQQATQ